MTNINEQRDAMADMDHRLGFRKDKPHTKNDAADAEISRLKFKVNALLDAVHEHASKAAAKRIIARMKEIIQERTK